MIAVPDSANSAALGYSEESGIPFELGLLRNHYVGRTFIKPDQKDRDFGARMKYNPVRDVLAGKRVVVATIGSELKDGAKVKKAMVGGVTSEGMLCDGPMLGWTGGGAGAAALLPESFKPGEAPPKSRPRLDGGGAGGDAPAAPAAKSTGPGVDSLFEKKLIKEEKKALQEKKKAERAAKKAAKGGQDAAEETKSDDAE